MLDNIFSSLKPLGFNDADKVEIYKQEVKIKVEVKENKPFCTDIDINTLIFDREISCPVCEHNFKTKAVKNNAPRIKSRDTDFLIRYNIINPLLYDVWVCPICGYAALKGDFHKIKKHQRALIIDKVVNNWQGKKYPPILNEHNAIERLKLALFNAVVSDAKNSTKAYICLKIAWIYRLLENYEEEKSFLKKALEGFLIAYSSEYTPFYGLDSHALMYLIGELYRRTDNNKEALLWFGNVIISRNAPFRIKEKARDMKELIKQEENSK